MYLYGKIYIVIKEGNENSFHNPNLTFMKSGKIFITIRKRGLQLWTNIFLMEDNRLKQRMKKLELDRLKTKETVFRKIRVFYCCNLKILLKGKSEFSNNNMKQINDGK